MTIKWLHELADPDRQVVEWRRIHAEKHERGLKFGGAKKPWPKCPTCQREARA
jgi:hypothetical protein